MYREKPAVIVGSTRNVNTRRAPLFYPLLSSTLLSPSFQRSFLFSLRTNQHFQSPSLRFPDLTATAAGAATLTNHQRNKLVISHFIPTSHLSPALFVKYNFNPTTIPLSTYNVDHDQKYQQSNTHSDPSSLYSSFFSSRLSRCTAP